MRSVRVVPGMTAVLVSLVAVAVAGCSPFSSSSSAAAPASQSASPAASTAAAAPAVSSSPTSSSGGVQNLDATAAVKSDLLAAFVAAKDIPVSDVAGSVPDSIYYAYDPATQTYWAKAAYEPKSTDPLSVTVDFQDGADTGLYKKSGTGPWQVTIGAEGPCTDSQFFPQVVLVAWAIPAPVGVTCQS